MSGYADYNNNVLQEFTETNDLKVYGALGLTSNIGFTFDKDQPPPTKIINIVLHNGHTLTSDQTVVNGTFKCEWRSDQTLYCKNNAVESEEYTIAKLVNGEHIFTREVNYHPESSQLFIPFSNKPFYMILGWSIETLAVYKFDGTKGVYIHPGIWHQPPIPCSTNDSMMFFTEQSRAHNCVIYDSIEKDRVWLVI